MRTSSFGLVLLALASAQMAQGQQRPPILRQEATLQPIAALPPGAAPTSLAVTPLNYHSVKLTWDAIAGARGYIPEKAFSPSGPWTPVVPAPYVHNNWEELNLAPHLTMYFRVSAHYTDSAPGMSPVVSVTLPNAYPTGFAAKVTSQGTVQLSWQSMFMARSYWLTGPGVKDASGAVTNAIELDERSQTHTVTGLAPGTYTYMLMAMFDVPGLGRIEGGKIDPALLPKATVTVTAPPVTVAAIPSPNVLGCQAGIKPPGEPQSIASLQTMFNDPANAGKTRFVVAVYLPASKATDAIRMVIEDGAPFGLGPDEIDLGLAIETTAAKEIVGLDGCLLATATQVRREAKGPPAFVRLRQSQVATIAFRKKTLLGWKDISHFDPAAFWPLLGGRRITFTWVGDNL